MSIISSNAFQTVRTDRSLDYFRPQTEKILSSIKDSMIALSVLALTLEVFGALGSGVQCIPVYAPNATSRPSLRSIDYIQKTCAEDGLSDYGQYLGYGFIVQIWLLMVVDNFCSVWSESRAIAMRCLDLVKECEASRFLRGNVIVQLNRAVGNYNFHQWTEEQQKWMKERNAEADLTPREPLTAAQLSDGVALSLKVSEFVENMVGSTVLHRVYLGKSFLRIVIALAFIAYNFYECYFVNHFEFDFDCGRENFLSAGFEDPETTFAHLDYKCTYLVANFSKTLVLLFALHLIAYILLAICTMWSWKNIDNAISDIMAEYRKTSDVEEVEEKLQSIEEIGYFCDLKLLLFLLKSGNKDGFVAFKDFLSPLFQRELIAMTTGTKWNKETIEKRMKEIHLYEDKGVEVNFAGLEVVYLPEDLLSCDKRIISLKLSYNKALRSLRGIGKLAHLKRLEAEGCDLEDGEIDFEEMTSLVSLNLMKNNLSALPMEIEKLTKLRELKVEANNLTRLPSALNKMPALKIIICEAHLMDSLDPKAEVWRLKVEDVYTRVRESVYE